MHKLLLKSFFIERRWRKISLKLWNCYWNQLRSSQELCAITSILVSRQICSFVERIDGFLDIQNRVEDWHFTWIDSCHLISRLTVDIWQVTWHLTWQFDDTSNLTSHLTLDIWQVYLHLTSDKSSYTWHLTSQLKHQTKKFGVEWLLCHEAWVRFLSIEFIFSTIILSFFENGIGWCLKSGFSQFWLLSWSWLFISWKLTPEIWLVNCQRAENWFHSTPCFESHQITLVFKKLPSLHFAVAFFTANRNSHSNEWISNVDSITENFLPIFPFSLHAKKAISGN